MILKTIKSLAVLTIAGLSILLSLAVYREVVNYPAVPQTVILDADAVEISGPIEPTMAAQVIEHINDLVSNNATEISIVIDTPGGVVTAATDIIQAMNTAQALGVTIKCYVHKEAMSAGVIILSECNERYAEFSAKIMWHSTALIGSGRFNDKSTRDLLEVISTTNNEQWAKTRRYFFPWYFIDNFDQERQIPALEVEANGFGYLRVIRKVTKQQLVLFPPLDIPEEGYLK